MEKWMENNYFCLIDKPINRILLMGTHNSGINKIMYDIPIPNKNYNSLRKIAKYVKPLRDYINKWTINQTLSIDEQLNIGVRAFDIKISYFNDKFYVTHTFVSQELEPILQTFNTFLDSHTKEVLILQIAYDYEYADTTQLYTEQLINLFVKYFGTKIYEKQFEIPTYGNMLFQDKRIIFIHRDIYNYFNPIIWNKNCLSYEWFNVNDIDGFEQKMNLSLSNIRNQCYKFNYVQFILTPTVGNIKKDLFNPFYYNGLKLMANQLKNSLLKKMIDNEDFDKMSGIYVDHIDNDTAKYIIYLNHL